MRHQSPLSKDRERPAVMVLSDGVTGYGRAIVRGVMRYANAQRRWLIHEELRHVVTPPPRGWRPCDGAIIGGSSTHLFDSVSAICPQIVRCSGSIESTLTPVVSLDDHAVGVMAAEHLLECRLERFAFYGLSESVVSKNRFEGFRKTVTRFGFPCLEAGLGWPSRIETDDQDYLPHLKRWIEQVPKPIGIMAVDDNAAHDVAAACLEADISVPDRIAIIGVNNDDLLCESAWPPLSSVDGDFGRVGFTAATMLDQMLKGREFVGGDRVVRHNPLRVVRRQSTDVLAIKDANVADAVRFIREHACDPCSVSDVLKNIPVGRRWLERQFVKMIGRNPHDEIMRVRVETGKKLLLQRELSISEIAERCGFSHTQNFQRLFRQLAGVTPGVFRKSLTSAS